MLVSDLRFSAVSVTEVISARPSPVGLSKQEALTELQYRQDLYALQPQHFADSDLDKLRVTTGGVCRSLC